MNEEKHTDVLQNKAHELHNSLVTILSCVEICRKADVTHSEVLKDCYDIIERQAKHMTGLLATNHIGPQQHEVKSQERQENGCLTAVQFPNGLRILVIDDNVDVADSLAVNLRSVGHEVFTANGGHAAIELCKEIIPEIVLLDIEMPEMDGYVVCEKLLQENAALKIVAIAGFNQEQDRRRAEAVGFVGYLVKPVDPAVLNQEIHRQKGIQ